MTCLSIEVIINKIILLMNLNIFYFIPILIFGSIYVLRIISDISNQKS